DGAAAPCAVAAFARSVPTSDARAAQPTAFAPRLKNWRRVSWRTHSLKRLIASRSVCACWRPPAEVAATLFVQDLVQVHQLVGQHGPRRERGRVERGVGLAVTDRD